MNIINLAHLTTIIFSYLSQVQLHKPVHFQFAFLQEHLAVQPFLHPRLTNSRQAFDDIGIVIHKSCQLSSSFV